MSTKNLLPSTETAFHIDPETGEVKLAAYRQGIPRQYRFNANKGNLNLNGEQSITKAGETIQLLPLCVRIFKDNLFEMGRKTWAELYFLNTANQVCVTMFHGYSVENLQSLESELYYENLAINQVILKITPEQKQNKSLGSKYYIARFDFEAASEELLTAQQQAINNYNVYRIDTASPDAEEILSLSYAQSPSIEAAVEAK